MENPVRILAFAGSTRKESWNKKLLRAAAETLAGQADAEVTVIDLADYPLPLYDGDLHAEKGLPENARRLKKLFDAHQGFLISSPEFNGSYPGLLKNALDWISAHDSAEDGLEPFRGKAAALISASPGKNGGLRGLEKLRQLMSDLQVTVLPGIFAVGSISAAFNEAGQLQDAKTAATLKTISQDLVRMARRLAP